MHENARLLVAYPEQVMSFRISDKIKRYVPMVGYTGAPRIVAISLLKACISLIASLDRTLQHLTISDILKDLLLLSHEPHGTCHGVN
jgi:hypothetical protein